MVAAFENLLAKGVEIMKPRFTFIASDVIHLNPEKLVNTEYDERNFNPGELFLCFRFCWTISISRQ